MKNILLLLCLFASFAVSAQRAITDTIQGAETVSFDAMQDASQVQVLATELGGTSDGKAVLKASVDGVTYTEVKATAGLIATFPTDTMAISNGSTWLIDLKKDVFNYYKIEATGTASDTTLITIKWSK